MFTNAPEFRLWIRRADAAQPPFELRWQVMGGRGTLLLPRGGGTDAAPATSSGTHSGLSAEALGATRFVVVSDLSQARSQFDLGPFETAALGALPTRTWTALGLDTEGTALVLSPTPRGADPAPRDPQARIAELEAEVAALRAKLASLETSRPS